MLNEGDKAPDFSAKDQDGNTVKLSDLKGQRVVLYFYPKDDTPGCTKEACSFRDADNVYQKKGIASSAFRPTTKSRIRNSSQSSSCLSPARRHRQKDRKCLRRLGRKVDVWQKIYGHEPQDVPDRRTRQDRKDIRQGTCPSTLTKCWRHLGRSNCLCVIFQCLFLRPHSWRSPPVSAPMSWRPTLFQKSVMLPQRQQPRLFHADASGRCSPDHSSRRQEGL